MSVSTAQKADFTIKEPKGLSPRIQWLRDYYYQGIDRAWNNEFTAWSTGTPWDVLYDETSFYVVPEAFAFNQTFSTSFIQAARDVPLPPDFWSMSLVERRTWFIKEVMVNHVPQEILPGDLIAGARFLIQTSMCLDEEQTKKRDKVIKGKNGIRKRSKVFHDHGFGNAGATGGHLIPSYDKALRIGWKGINAELSARYDAMSDKEKKGPKGAQLRAMMSACTMPKELAAKYSKLCYESAANESGAERKAELMQMGRNLDRVPWEPAETFWEAVQSLWITHMLCMSDENYPGPGLSFGRIDQFLFPYWEKSLKDGMDREFGKEIMKCFWVHCNTAYDAMIQTGNNGITAAYGQLITLGGVGAGGRDMTNDLTLAMLEVIDEMSPILEPKPNVRLHRNTPDEFLDKIADMIADSQGAPFLLNFDERSMAGMLREAKEAGIENLINDTNVHEYAPVGCLENTMCGNDRSGTVDLNLNLVKAVELALTGGEDLIPYGDLVTGEMDKIRKDGAPTKPAVEMQTWEEFWDAYAEQTRHIVKMIVDLYEVTESLRAEFAPTAYLSCLVKGCAEKGLDITQGGAEISFTTLETVTFATTVDSLLAVKYLVFDKKECTMAELIQALKDNWIGHEILQAKAKNKAPKYGRDDDEADELARKVMDLWTGETWKYKTKSTNRQFRPGMLSWNYWVGDGYVLPATPDGRPKGQFLSNAICPSTGADINGPTANANSVGKALGGKAPDGKGDFEDYLCSLPNGASHTMSFNPSIIQDPEHREKFKAFLRGYIANGGTALQINMLDPEMLRDAQRRPQDYRHLLVRVTGYNAYFTSIGKELQDEVIARLSHERL
jgi:pyruvate-formate lyase